MHLIFMTLLEGDIKILEAGLKHNDSAFFTRGSQGCPQKPHRPEYKRHITPNTELLHIKKSRTKNVVVTEFLPPWAITI